MSVISLLNEQLKNNLNKTTRELLFSISDKFNLPYESLLNSWNKLNPEFNFNFTKIVIEDDDEKHIEDVRGVENPGSSVPSLNQPDLEMHRTTILKPVIEDEEIKIKPSGYKKIQIVIED